MAPTELDWPTALLTSGLAVAFLLGAVQEMREGKRLPALCFFATALLFAIWTYYADPRYRHLSLPTQPPPLGVYFVVASGLSIVLGVLGKLLRTYRIGESTKNLVAKIREFDKDWAPSRGYQWGRGIHDGARREGSRFLHPIRG